MFGDRDRIWEMTIVIQTILFDNLHLDNKPVVTAWKNGWGDVWGQIIAKEDLQMALLLFWGNSLLNS
jgi:hypothetical protein